MSAASISHRVAAVAGVRRPRPRDARHAWSGRSPRRRRCRPASRPRGARRAQVAPAQPNRSAPVRRHSTRCAARPRQPALGVALRLVADAQLDRVDAERDGELVHRRLQREHARGLPRRPHDRRRRDVERRQPVRRPPVRRRRTCTRVATAVCSANSLIREVCSTTSWLIAVSRPSASAPSRSRWMVGVRCPTRENICCRVSSSFTGRPGDAARPSRRASLGCGNAFDPKAPPTYGEMTRTCLGVEPEHLGQVVDDVCGPWLASQRVSESPSQRAHRGVHLDRVVVLGRRLVVASTVTARGRQRAVDVAITESVVEAGHHLARARRGRGGPRAGRRRASCCVVLDAHRPAACRAISERLGDDRRRRPGPGRHVQRLQHGAGRRSLGPASRGALPG